MPLWVTYAVSQGHGVIQARAVAEGHDLRSLLYPAISRSMALPPLGSVFMSMIPVATQGFATPDSMLVPEGQASARAVQSG